MYGSMERDGDMRHRGHVAAPSLRRREPRIVRCYPVTALRPVHWSHEALCATQPRCRNPSEVRQRINAPRIVPLLDAKRAWSQCDHARSGRPRQLSGDHELDPTIALPHPLTGSLHGGRLLASAFTGETLCLDAELDQKALDRRRSALAQLLVVVRCTASVRVAGEGEGERGVASQDGRLLP